ncbi:unnamed protein product [Bursaphelenchus okinawaensis]|uniref:ABC transporter domain-containing protein n=1 Tax=Bursaphelenchus okinawaensis TaxID=465554 RepID=A0A811KSC6_9BILA|nr:unnamed protein product [Bursaphelenchus okinawaensis]CAG9111330.1 unnamed protein product [Bursaphelenchus okinawaensis]
MSKGSKETTLPSTTNPTNLTEVASTKLNDSHNDSDSFLQSIEKGKTLTWNKITVKVPDLNPDKGGFFSRCKKKNDDLQHRTVLKDVYGVAKAGEMVAIMGGSGAGKTTLMNQFVNIDQKDIQRTGDIRVNGQILSVSQMRRITAYVQQHDVFVGSLTVREQLMFSARLRMGRKKTAKDRKETVERLIHDLNLLDCQNTIIGVPNQVKGISVGEKKRLAFACELLNDPAILFCDEPTSGLDSFMSEQVISSLRKFTSTTHKTVVLTIHQPSDEVFKLFDKVCFMAMGQVAFFGDPSQVCRFWQQIAPGYEKLKLEKKLKASIGDLVKGEEELVCPDFHGPAEHSIRMLSKLSDDEQLNKARVTYIRECFESTRTGKKLKKQANEAAEIEISKHQDIADGKSWLTQVTVLFQRSFLTTLRDPLLLKVRCFQVFATAIVIGIVNWQTQITGPTVMNIEGILYNCPRDMNFMFLVPSIHVITSELPIMRREHRGGIYSVSSYYVAKSLAETPQYTILPLAYSAIVYWMSGLAADAIKFTLFSVMNVLLSWVAISLAYAIACVFGVEDLAQTSFPIIVLPMLMFGGFYINFNAIPIYFQWISHVSWFRYGFEGLQIIQWKDFGEIGDCEHRNDTGGGVSGDDYCPAKNGVDLLHRRDMNENNIYLCFGVVALVMIVGRTVGLIALQLRMKYAK